VSIKLLTARPLLGAIRPSVHPPNPGNVSPQSALTHPSHPKNNSQHPSGTATANSVSTSPLPLFPITHALAAYRSYPAANALPRVGVFALSESFFTRSGGDDERGGGGGAAFWLGEEGRGLVVVLDGGGSGSVVVFVRVGGDMVLVLVRLGSGELGREGGECGGGVVDMFLRGGGPVGDVCRTRWARRVM
jgi:hypothetical protein